MYILYDLNSYIVLDIVEYIKIEGDYLIVVKNNIKVKYYNNGLGVSVVVKDNITFSDNAPLIYDVEQGLVYPDPFYVEEEVPDDGSDDESGGSDEEKPMTAAEMRTKIKELEEQLAATKILLGVE